MKTTILLALMLLVSTFVWSSDKVYQLEYKLKPGETYNYNEVNNSTIMQQFMGQEINSRVVIDMMTEYKVKDVSATNFTIELMYDRIVGEVAASMGGDQVMDMKYDSNSEDTVFSEENISPLFKALTNTPFSLTVSKQGKVEAVEGTEKMMDAMIAAIGDELDEEDIDAILSSAGGFDNQSMQTAFERLTSYMPHKPVSIGESWFSQMEVNSGGLHFITEMKWTLKSVEGHTAIIEADGKMTVPENVFDEEIEMTVAMTGTEKGFLYVDMNTGWPIKFEMLQNMKGSITTMGMEIPMEIKTETVMEKK